ncbi:MAG TPA: O-antigen ligase family protein [Candidatus Binatia bacterium]|nr:O-antigen ligase family protein [Candidatus Binatia bacterium]
MPTLAVRRPATPATMPFALRLGLALAIPFIAALTIAGTYLGKEVIVCAAWIALSTVGILFVNPVTGIAVMTSGFMLAAYPTVFDALGALTINNLLGVGFVVLLIGYVLDTRDVSFLKVRPIVILMAIGVIFLVGSIYSQSLFPMLRVSQGKRFSLDRTDQMGHDFITRLVFLIFYWIFVRSRREIRAIYLTVMFSLFMAVPSALYNWEQGTLISGFRAAASLTSGANPNRLAMICLSEVAFWWYWSRSRPGWFRRMIGYGPIAGAITVVFASGSRSGLLGIFVLGTFLQTGEKRYRVPVYQIALFGLMAIVAVLFLVPVDSLERMINFTPDRHTYGYHSTLQRLDTIYLALHMMHDHLFSGVGLGNFREVARQIYLDPYFRPPHNSYLWAMTEGGIFVLIGYGLLFWTTWRDIGVVLRLAYRDPEIGFIAAALRVAFVQFMFFAAFADMWLNPITYILIAQVITLRRYVEGLPDPATPAVVRRPARPRLAFAMAS